MRKRADEKKKKREWNQIYLFKEAHNKDMWEDETGKKVEQNLLVLCSSRQKESLQERKDDKKEQYMGR